MIPYTVTIVDDMEECKTPRRKVILYRSVRTFVYSSTFQVGIT